MTAGEITGVTDGAGREFRLVLTHAGAACGRGPHSLRYLLLTVPPLSQPQRSSTHRPVPEYGPDRGIRLSAVWRCTTRHTRKEPARCATGAVHGTEAGKNCWRYMTAAIRRCALSRMTRSTRPMVAHRYAGSCRRCATATTIRGGW